MNDYALLLSCICVPIPVLITFIALLSVLPRPWCHKEFTFTSDYSDLRSCSVSANVTRLTKCGLAPVLKISHPTYITCSAHGTRAKIITKGNRIFTALWHFGLDCIFVLLIVRPFLFLGVGYKKRTDKH